MQKTSPQSYKTQMKILAYPGLVKSGSGQPSPGAPLLRLTKIYISTYKNFYLPRCVAIDFQG